MVRFYFLSHLTWNAPVLKITKQMDFDSIKLSNSERSIYTVLHSLVFLRYLNASEKPIRHISLSISRVGGKKATDKRYMFSAVN